MFIKFPQMPKLQTHRALNLTGKRHLQLFMTFDLWCCSPVHGAYEFLEKVQTELLCILFCYRFGVRQRVIRMPKFLSTFSWLTSKRLTAKMTNWLSTTKRRLLFREGTALYFPM